jgi:hypothetical protein
LLLQRQYAAYASRFATWHRVQIDMYKKVLSACSAGGPPYCRNPAGLPALRKRDNTRTSAAQLATARLTAETAKTPTTRQRLNS